MSYKFLRQAIVSLFFLTMPYYSFADGCNGKNAITSVIYQRPVGAYEFIEFTVNSTDLNYQVTSVNPPFISETTGEILKIGGKKFKKIQFNGVAWQCTINAPFSVPKKQVTDIKNVAQFEGIVSYIIGYQSEKKYIATEKKIKDGVTKIIMKFNK